MHIAQHLTATLTFCLEFLEFPSPLSLVGALALWERSSLGLRQTESMCTHSYLIDLFLLEIYFFFSLSFSNHLLDSSAR